MLVGNLIHEQLMKARNWPFAAALSVVLMVLTSLMIAFYRRISGVKGLEGLKATKTADSKVLKNRTIANVYLGLMIVLMYVPIVLVIIYSFNESKISSVW